MSKSTERYGKVLYSMSTNIDGTPKPSEDLKHEWARFDTAAEKEFGKKYDALTGGQKSALHQKLNEQRQKNRERKEKVA